MTATEMRSTLKEIREKKEREIITKLIDELFEKLSKEAEDNTKNMNELLEQMYIELPMTEILENVREDLVKDGWKCCYSRDKRCVVMYAS